jgi:hypothetical protein
MIEARHRNPAARNLASEHDLHSTSPSLLPP